MNFKTNNELQFDCRGLALVLALFAGTATGGVGDTERVSVANDGTEAIAGAAPWKISISEDGRFVVFNSTSDDLVDYDPTSGCCDLFLRDRKLETTEMVSVSTDGEVGYGTTYESDITPDGRYVVFESWAANLDSSACNANGTGDIYVRDRVAGTTECISFHSDGVTVSNGRSQFPAVSGDGRYIAYTSAADNLVDDDTNGVADVFVHDRHTGETKRISVTDNGDQANGKSVWLDITRDGRFVVFDSAATNLVPDDSNAKLDVFIHDTLASTTRRVSVTSTGAQSDGGSGSPRISANGQFVVFHSSASNLKTVPGGGDFNPYIHNLLTGETESVNINDDGIAGHGRSIDAVVSGDGRFVAYQSQANNLDGRDNLNDWNYFVRDRQEGTVQLVDVSSEGEKSNPSSTFFNGRVAISENGRFVAFSSPGINLVPDDLNDQIDTFVHQIRPFTPQEMIEEVISLIVDLNLNNGISNSLDAKLNSAVNALADVNQNNDVAACNSLDALINAVEAQSGGMIPVEDALEIIDSILEIQAELACG
jgi:Tol biopolymer transport system component